MHKRIIIVGGMGPQASIELHRRLIRQASNMGARNGNEFPEIIHISLPIDDFIADKSKTKQALVQIQSALERLYPWQAGYRRYSMQYGSSFAARA